MSSSFIIFSLHLLKTNTDVCCTWNCVLSLAEPVLKNENNRHSLKLDLETSSYTELVSCKFSWWKPRENTCLKGFWNEGLNHRSLQFLTWSLLQTVEVFYCLVLFKKTSDFFEGT